MQGQATIRNPPVAASLALPELLDALIMGPWPLGLSEKPHSQPREVPRSQMGPALISCAWVAQSFLRTGTLLPCLATAKQTPFALPAARNTFELAIAVSMRVWGSLANRP
jgi:ACR3 family arsenite efflux pump ArsB